MDIERRLTFKRQITKGASEVFVPNYSILKLLYA